MRIAIIANPVKDKSYECSRKTAEYLLGRGAELFADTNEISDRVNLLPTEKCVEVSDLVITVGGDGTILHIADIASKKNKPLLGINLGKVGYMAEIEPDELYLLDRLFIHDYMTENRGMLSFSVVRGGKTVYQSDALNDVVISRGKILKMSELQLSENKNPICSYSADGLIFSTPTGSTAYTLSAGGPVIDPKLDCIIVTPICAHTLSLSRSVVFRPDSDLRVKLLSDNSPYLTSDGSVNFLLEQNDEIVIGKSCRVVSLIKLKNQSFYEKLAHKLK